MAKESVGSTVGVLGATRSGGVEFVQSSANRFGIGRLRDSDSLWGTIEYFDSPTREERPVRRVPLSTIRKVSLPVQTRVHHRDPETGQWRVGRAVEFSDARYRVKFPNRVEEWIGPEELFVRWKCPIQDPTDHLAMRLNETPMWYERRTDLVASITQQRAAAAGMTGLLSASISLEAHQVEVARRVLQDPVQRYLLADEVGLGKTIEAGILIRQYVLDQPIHHTVHIVVPEQLTGQWRRELCEKFGLSRWLYRTIHVIANSDRNALEAMEHSRGMLVIDEAHHVAAWAKSPAADERKRFDILGGVADRAERLLLLSATPVLHNERSFLAMLHLLDPVVYRLEDEEGFARRVAARQQIAEIYHLLTPETPSMLLQQAAVELPAQFPADSRLSELMAELTPLLDFDIDPNDPRRAAAIERLRIHLGETYRLHRRLLRSRRTPAIAKLLPGRAGTQVLMPPASALEATFELLDQWRVEASAAVQDLPAQAKTETAELFRILFDAAGADPWVLREIAAYRLAQISDAPGPPAPASLSAAERATVEKAHRFATERGNLQSLIRHLDATTASGVDPRLTTLEYLLNTRLPGDPKIIIFTTFPETADRIVAHLRSVYGEISVARHRVDSASDAEGMADPIAYGWRQFETSPFCGILVCDRRAEEGLNLQGGNKLLFHFDLPSSPNRLEQRLGRVDRFGDGTPVQSYTFFYKGIPLLNAWANCLDKGFSVFRQSIASLQYLIDEKMRELWPAVLSAGALPIRQLKRVLAEEGGLVARELKRIRVQDELDSMEVPQAGIDPTAGFIARLQRQDDTSFNMQSALDQWACECLRLGRFCESSTDESVTRYTFRYGPGNQTLMPPTDIADRFSAALDAEAPGHTPINLVTVPVAFTRSQARRWGTGIARIGHPLIDALGEQVRTDDRGICAAVWRYRPQSNAARPAEIFFEFNFVVEADVTAAEEIISGLARSNVAAVRRRADELFPPIVRTVWLDGQLQPMDRAALRPEITERYTKHIDSLGQDFNLNADRWTQIEAMYERANWWDLCRGARAAAETALTEQIELRQLTESHARRATERARRTSEQMRSRLDYLPPQSRADEQAQIDLASQLDAAIAAGILKPSVRCDSLQVVFLSAINPFAGQDSGGEG